MARIVSGGATRGGLAVQSLLVAYLRASSTMVLLTLAAGLVLAWGVSHVMGGSRTPFPHLFYLPIILAAVRSSWVGGLGTAIAAGLLAGPALPADVPLGIAQPLEAWTLRLAIFMAVGGLVVGLTRGHSQPLGRRFSDRLASSRLTRAVHGGELEVYYQPICNTLTGRIVGLEALSRWTGSGQGTVSPGDFIPPAERTGAITVLDRFVLRQAVRQAQAWSTEIAPIDISVNVSAAWFADRDLVAEVETVLAETGLPPAQLQLEITESAIIEDVAATRRQVADLRQLGVRVAIDDFGTGQSSLSYLDQFGVDTVKIDRTLVAPVTARADSGRLVAGIVQLLQAMGLNVVAEGVESTDQHARLRALSCPLVQGYHFGRPAPAGATEGILHAEQAISRERARLLDEDDVPEVAVVSLTTGAAMSDLTAGLTPTAAV